MGILRRLRNAVSDDVEYDEEIERVELDEGSLQPSQTTPLPVSIPTATYQAFEKAAHSERFLIHLLGSQLKGGMAALYSQFDVSNPDVLSQITNQLAIEGKDVSNPLSLFGNDVDNATSEMKKALQAALEWSKNNDDQVNVSKSGQVEKRPVLRVLDSRVPRNILAEDAQKLQNLFLAVFENASEVDLSAPNAFDVWYSKINQGGIPEVQLHCERIPAAAMQSGDLSQQSALTTPARLGFVDSVERAEGLMWSATGKAALACVVAGAGVAVAAISGGALLPLAATAFSVSGMGFTATAVGSAATTALSAGAGVVSAGIEVVQAVGGLFNRQHEMAHAR
jgi:hypothetical protein